jgi:hypothetical protein
LEGDKYLIISHIDDFRGYATQNRENNDYDRHSANLASFREMEKSGQRCVFKFFFLKCFASKAVYKEFTLSCEDKFRPGLPPHGFGKALSDFLEEFPFATAGIIAQYFSQSIPTIKEFLQQECRLQTFARRWVPHSLSDAQKVNWTAMSTDLLSFLPLQADYSFLRSVRKDESWLLSLYPSGHMFAAS